MLIQNPTFYGMNFCCPIEKIYCSVLQVLNVFNTMSEFTNPKNMLIWQFESYQRHWEIWLHGIILNNWKGLVVTVDFQFNYIPVCFFLNKLYLPLYLNKNRGKTCKHYKKRERKRKKINNNNYNKLKILEKNINKNTCVCIDDSNVIWFPWSLINWNWLRFNASTSTEIWLWLENRKNF